MDFYFDNAATTRLSDKAAKAYVDTANEFFGNPSSIHRAGRKAKEELERRRYECASILGVEPRRIVFTSGATDSIAIFFSSLLWQEPGEIILSRIEHEAVASWCNILKHHGWKVSFLKARKGFVTAEELEAMLTPDTRVVAIMAVNNSIGTIQPIAELVHTVREYEKSIRHRILFFSDSVQALGKTVLKLKSWDVDGASFSAHKINGPRGIGMLYLKTPESLRPIAPAGGQENGKRGGTENLPAIAGLAEALKEWKAAEAENEKRISGYNAKLRKELASIGVRILSPDKDCSPYILSVATALPSEVFTRMLFDKGFCVSSGSACSNNAKGKSEAVLEAMGISHDTAGKAIRISFSKDTQDEEIDALINGFKELING